MPDATNQRRMAAEILKCGLHRVWIDPTRIEDVDGVITRKDVRSAIASGAIAKKPILGISNSRKKYLMSQRKKGRRRGPGSRKGAQNARTPRKEKWMKTIRAVRSHLRGLRDSKSIAKKDYRKLYRQSKGGVFKSRAHLQTQIKLSGVLIKKEGEK